MTDDLQELSVLLSGLPELPRAVASSLDEKGFAVLEGVFDRRSIEAARGVVADAVDRASKDPSMRVADGAPMVPLLNAGQPIDRLWSHPLILAAVRHLVGPAFRLQHVRCRNPRGGHGSQDLHSEGSPSPIGSFYLVNVIVPLVDFTLENGATRVIPGTHIMDPKKIKYERAELARQAIEVPMRLGDALVFSGHLMHSGMVNRSSAIRTSVQAFYVRRGLEHFSAEGLEEPTNETLDSLGDLGLLLI